MSPYRTLDDLDVKGKRVLVRADLNVPMQNGRVADATRIERQSLTIRELADKGARVVVLSHFDRPKGKIVPSMSLKRGWRRRCSAGGGHKACRLFVADCIGEAAEAAVAAIAGRRSGAARKYPLPSGRGEERSRFRARARQAWRYFRQRRLLGGASRPCLDRRPGACSSFGGGPCDAGRTRAPSQGARQSRTSGAGSGRRRQNFHEDRAFAESADQSRCAGDRRRHGEHLLCGARLSDRQIAGRTRSARDRAPDHERRRDPPHRRGGGPGVQAGRGLPHHIGKRRDAA